MLYNEIDDMAAVVREIENYNNNNLILNFLNEGREAGLLNSLLLVGGNLLEHISNNNQVENNIINRVINESFIEKPKYKNVLSKEGEAEITKIKYNKNIHTNNICPIYHTEFITDTIVAQLPCNHIFSPEGIERWLKEENAICPICRYKLLSCEKKVKHKNEYIIPDLSNNQTNVSTSDDFVDIVYHVIIHEPVNYQ
jgi:hypothetical protein